MHLRSYCTGWILYEVENSVESEQTLRRCGGVIYKAVWHSQISQVRTGLPTINQVVMTRLGESAPMILVSGTCGSTKSCSEFTKNLLRALRPNSKCI